MSFEMEMENVRLYITDAHFCWMFITVHSFLLSLFLYYLQVLQSLLLH